MKEYIVTYVESFTQRLKRVSVIVIKLRLALVSWCGQFCDLVDLVKSTTQSPGLG